MVEQGSAEWRAMRCGKVTASRVADIMRKGRSGAVSLTRERYKGELVAERLTGVVLDGYRSNDMEWGASTEAEACDCYAFRTNLELISVDFVTHPTRPMCGASPDRLVGSDGLLEIKCPATHTHIATLLGAPIEPDYVKQMAWQMECTGRSWCDFVSYDPRMPEDMRMEVRRVHRDAALIAEITSAVTEFLAEIDATVAALEAKYRRAAA